MIKTNKLNLPDVFVNFYDSEDKGIIADRYSVTELLKSSKEINLRRKHYDEIESDICDSIPAMFGSAVHYILEKNAPVGEDLLTEYKFECNIRGKTIVGKCDLLDLKNKEIIDYKTSSTSTVMRGEFNDYYLQDMCYALMTYIKFGVKIKKLKNYVLMKDWSKLKSAVVNNYPASPIYLWEYEVQDSDYDFILKYIRDKIKDIEEDTKDCTDEERWFTGNSYAVFASAGDKKAKKVFKTLVEAELYRAENNYEYIETRKGQYIKCDYYCDCNKFCEQYRKEKENGDKSI